MLRQPLTIYIRDDNILINYQPMVPVSIVIITKNEAEVIGRCLEMSILITDDILIMDNGSTDETLAIAASYGCRIYQNNWEGYGANKNIGIELARYDWILSLDADEVPDPALIEAIHRLRLNEIKMVYDLKFRSYFGKKRIRFGHWGRDHHIRLFNRKLVKWSEPKVHENLILPKEIEIKKLKGYLHHYSVKDQYECNKKAVLYAHLSAEKYFKAGKKASLIGLLLSPAFSFVVSYLILLGFLDGKQGWHISKATFKNKWLKYQYLHQLEQQQKQFPERHLVVEY